MRSAREVAEEMVLGPTEDHGGNWWFTICDEVYDFQSGGWSKEESVAKRDAKGATGVIERLVIRERAPLVDVLREVAEHLRDDVCHADTGSEHGDRIEALLAKVAAVLKESGDEERG